MRRRVPANDGDRQELRASATVIVVVVALIIFIYVIRAILLPFVFAGILALIFTPLIDRLSRRTGKPRWLFALAVLTALLIVAAAFGYLALPALLDEIKQVGGNLDGTVQSFVGKFVGNGKVTMLDHSISAASIARAISSDIDRWFGQSGRMLQVATYSIAAMFGFILAWVLLGYLLFDARKISQGLFWLVPPHHRPFVHRVWERLNPILRRYFAGVAMVVIYAATFAYIGLGLILHLHHAVLLALFTGFLEVIPILGPAASAVIAGLVAVREAQSSWNILAYAGYAILLRVSIDEFFGPIVLGKAAYIRPVLVIFCFLAGGLLFGIVGMVLAVPVALTIKISLDELYRAQTGRLS